VKHSSINSVTLVEIDEAVIRVSKTYLPSLAIGFAHPKVKVVVGDGFQYLKDNAGAFDVIITDSSDPVGPAESLFGEGFFELMRRSLRIGGIVCTQGECMWLHLDLIKKVITSAKKLFPSVGYAFSSVPTYPCGNIGFVLCGLDEGVVFKQPKRMFEGEAAKSLKYYTKEIHEASFVLPRFCEDLGL